MSMDRRTFVALAGAAALQAATGGEMDATTTGKTADPRTYLSELVAQLRKQWPKNRTVNIVCHGHSVPAGYFKTPRVDSFNAYPHLLHVGLKQRFPDAVINVIVAGIGGEESDRGAARFERDVLGHRPDLITIDYALNDRRIGLEKARGAWESMIAAASQKNVQLLLCTPTSDVTQRPGATQKERAPLREHAAQIRELAAKHALGLVDSLAAFDAAMASGVSLESLLSQPNHPNRGGHDLVVKQLLEWFPVK